MARPAIAAATAFGGGLYFSWRYAKWTESLPLCTPGTLLTGQDDPSGASSSDTGAIAVCAYLPAQRLSHLGVSQPPGSNYARLDRPTMTTILERLVSGYAEVPPSWRTFV